LVVGRERVAVGGVLKRGVDVVVATSALVLLAPMLVVTGVLIRLLLGRPIMVTERSVGLGGQVFALLSFRTELNSSTSADPWTEALTTALRASGIDKLPHLCNVVRGDMSLVGPELIGAHHALARSHAAADANRPTK
jgi:lipopolysaccharide/colanic/teichoic acid biosynthesis glycosyltransferase